MVLSRYCSPSLRPRPRHRMASFRTSLVTRVQPMPSSITSQTSTKQHPAAGLYPLSRQRPPPAAAVGAAHPRITVRRLTCRHSACHPRHRAGVTSRISLVSIISRFRRGRPLKLRLVLTMLLSVEKYRPVRLKST